MFCPGKSQSAPLPTGDQLIRHATGPANGPTKQWSVCVCVRVRARMYVRACTR